MFEFITAIRALATVLITNSHYEIVYPIKALATGGLLGNSLFFIVSGFCLANIKEPFIPWFSKRIVRIYPSCFIASVVWLLLGGNLNGIGGFIRLFIYPTKFGFLSKIIALYIPYYFILKGIKHSVRTKISWISGSLTCMVFGLLLLSTIIVPQFCEWFYYLALMLLGANIRTTEVNPSKTNRICFGLLSFGLLVTYYAVEWLIRGNSRWVTYNALNYLTLLACTCFIIMFFRMLEDVISRIAEKKLYKLISFLADRTLEIYLAQVLILPIFPQLPFPLSVFVLTVLIIILASILKIIGDFLIKIVNRGFLLIITDNH